MESHQLCLHVEAGQAVDGARCNEYGGYQLSTHGALPLPRFAATCTYCQHHEGSDTADFIEAGLKELSNLHFNNTPTSSTKAPPTLQTQIPFELESENKSTVLAKTTAEQEAEPSK